MAPIITRHQGCCIHGSPANLTRDVDPRKKALLTLMAAIHEIRNRKAQELENSGKQAARGTIGTEAAAIMISVHKDCINESMRKLLLCCGTDCVLQNAPWYFSHAVAEAALFLGTLLNMDRKEFDQMEEDSRNGGSRFTFTKTDQELCKQINDLDSVRAIVRFLAKRIPCKCLANKKKEFNIKEGRCKYDMCYSAVPDAELMDCGACHLVKYCGKECQRSDWSRHKELCKMAQKKISEGKYKGVPA
jgi:hypothetical protein